jgi:prepilin-type N-terminal cleavage/methylation domain-containing protein
MTRRSGVTLVEVMVAMFIMALGLMSLLTLFPLGALRMAQAIKDDRTKFAADNANAVGRMWWHNIWIDGNKGTQLTYRSALPNEPLLGALNNNLYTPFLGSQSTAYWTFANPVPPNAPLWPVYKDYSNTNASNPTYVDITAPGVPVFVDPIGFNVITLPNPTSNPSPAQQAQQSFLGGQEQVPGNGVNQYPLPLVGGQAVRYGGIPRRSLAQVQRMGVQPPNVNSLNNPFIKSSLQAAVRMCTLPDDIEFTNNGRAVDFPPIGTVQRGGKFTFAWLLQRDHNAYPDQVRMTTVIYSGRSADFPNDERVYTGFVSVGSTGVTLIWSGNPDDKPKIKKGGWILDSGRNQPMDALGNLNPAGPFPVYLKANFYRVVAINEDTSTSMTLELQTPVSRGSPGVAPGTIEPVNLIVMDNVAEVFDRGLISPASIPEP